MAELWQRGKVVVKWPEGHLMHGCEITMRRRPLGEITNAWVNASSEPDQPWAALTPKERAARTEANAADLAGLITGWNIADDDGVPVLITADGILAVFDQEMFNDVWDAYNAATTRLSPPLPKKSVDGPGEWDLGPQEVLPAAD